MTEKQRVVIHLAEGAFTPRSAKTSRGVIAYGKHRTLAVVDSTSVGKSCHDCIGVGGDVPVVASFEDALALTPRADTLLVGITNQGGILPAGMRAAIRRALDEGLDVWNGLHQFLALDPEFSAAASASGARIWDVRRPGFPLPVGRGARIRPQTPGLLSVGTDCAVGKMTALLEMQRAAEARGLRAPFIPTGQTGMMIAGFGHPIDAIPGDFMAGCVEEDCQRFDGDSDLILVEGQGSLWHPGFSSVTLALLHGAMPDLLLLCHQPSRRAISQREHIAIPPLDAVRREYERAMAIFKEAKTIGVALNTWGMPEDDARAAIAEAEAATGLPATDPARFGAGMLLDAALAALGR